jgi:hypothetical protein
MWYTRSAMEPTLPYRFSEPPEELKKVRLDNIALVPASLLPLKGTYQVLANRLPTGSVLVVSGTPGQQKIMEKVRSFFREHGRQVMSVTIERFTRSIRKNVFDNRKGSLPQFWGLLGL